MIIGDPNTFAIESGITSAYDRLSFRALGFFVLFIGGRRYGVYKPDASLLACSFEEVKDRIAQRGLHTAPFAVEHNAERIADTFREAIFGDEPAEQYLGFSLAEIRSRFYTELNDCMWAPDGDEAFDDGSFVLQFDIDDRVRLIAFQSGDGNSYISGTLRDVWLKADTFYDVLKSWYAAFESEWHSMEKTAECATPPGP